MEMCPTNLDELMGTYGTYMWFPEHGTHLIKASDLAEFSPPGCKVFKCVGIESPWLVLEYAGKRAHVLPDRFRAVTAPSFSIGDRVRAPRHGAEQSGEVADIYWHFKNAEPYYYVTFDGRRSNRRYTASELKDSS